MHDSPQNSTMGHLYVNSATLNSIALVSGDGLMSGMLRISLPIRDYRERDDVRSAGGIPLLAMR